MTRVKLFANRSCSSLDLFVSIKLDPALQNNQANLIQVND